MDKQTKMHEFIENGTVIGSWTVGDPIEKNGKLYYHCVCECGKESDVSAANLARGKSRSCGCQKKTRANSSSGCPGVIWSKKHKRWNVSFTRRGQHIYLGSFVNLEDAVEARKDAEALFKKEGMQAFAKKRKFETGSKEPCQDEEDFSWSDDELVDVDEDEEEDNEKKNLVRSDKVYSNSISIFDVLNF